MHVSVYILEDKHMHYACVALQNSCIFSLISSFLQEQRNFLHKIILFVQVFVTEEFKVGCSKVRTVWTGGQTVQTISRQSVSLNRLYR